MHFLFVSAPLVGHLDWGGYLSTAVELVRRGHDVRWVSGQAVMPVLAAQGVPGVAVEETGWRWPLPPPLDPKSVGSREEYQRLRMVRSLDQWFELDRVRQATRDFLRIAEAWRPDVVVSEMFIAAAGIVAERLDVPFVVAGWPALRTSLPPQARFIAEMARQRLDALREEFGVQGINWAVDGPPALLSPHLHLTYWSPRWFAGLPLLPQNRHVGGIAPPSQPWQTPWLEHLPMDQPWIFITLGTAFTNDPNFFIAAAHAAVQVGGVPILAIGEDVNTPAAEQLRSRLPAGAVVAGRINFAEVLPYAAAAIHHGGAGTTHALVTHAVPQIVVPHAADQGRQAEGVVRSGVGYHFPPRQVTVPRLVQALQNIIPDESPARQNARALQAEFASLGGAPRAAALLEEVGRGDGVTR